MPRCMTRPATSSDGPKWMRATTAERVSSFSRLRETSADKTYRARATIGLGMAYRNASDYDKALECYKEVVATMPGSEYAEESMMAIESIYQRLGQPGKFLEYVEQNALGTPKTDAEREKMYFNTAEQLYLAGNYAETVTTVGKVPRKLSRERRRAPGLVLSG